MTKWLKITFYILIAGIIAWGFITPNGIRAAFANNLWSIKFLDRVSRSPSSFDELPSPPSSHAYADLWLSHQALKSGNEAQALTLIQPLVEAADPLALDTQAKILFNQGQYDAAFDIWESTSNARSLDQAWATLIGTKNSAGLIYRANTILYGLRPEEYTTWYASSLILNNEIDQAILVLEKSITAYPNSDQKATWLRILGNLHPDQ